MSDIYIPQIFTSESLKICANNTSSTKIYAKGDVIAHAGRKIEKLHYLIKGKVKYVIITANGEELTQFFTVAPALFAETPFFSGLPSFGSFIACEKCHIQLIDRDDVSRECLEALCVQMARKLRVAHLQYESTFNSAESRIARHFYTLSLAVGTNIVDFNQRELASMTGLHYMTVNKIIKKFEETNVIIRRGKCIEIIDPQSIMLLAGLDAD